MVGGTFAQSSLPPCKGDVSNWTNCLGAETFASGDKYVGEWKDGKRHGQGIEYKADGTVAASGYWSNANLINSYALDLKRFPFNAPLQTARPSNAETDRLTANTTLAQTSLPACQGTNFFNLNNCFGTHVFPDGAKYFGEWKEIVMYGRGTFTSSINSIPSY